MKQYYMLYKGEEMEQKLMVTNIQRMCFHDGPGIRTTIFFKGCSIHCPWCSNPENLHYYKEEYYIDGKKGIYGKAYSCSELIEMVCKDQIYWDKDGGVTFSGGEALLQADALLPMCRRLKERKIHVVVETSLFILEKNLNQLIEFIDYFIVDVKILQERECYSVLGGDVDLYKKNVNTLYYSGKLKLFRIPCCLEYTLTTENREKIASFLRNYKDIPVEVFAIHELGEKKYQSLGKSMWKSQKLKTTDLDKFCLELQSIGVSVQIIKL